MSNLAKNVSKVLTEDLIKSIHPMFDYSYNYEERIAVVNKIDELYGGDLEDNFAHYKTSNLKTHSNRVIYDKLCSLYDRMSEYILFANLDKEFEDSLPTKKEDYPFMQESNLKTMQSGNEISFDSYVTMLSKEQSTDIKYDDQNHATYKLSQFRDRIMECPYNIQGYFDFNKHARALIQNLEAQIKELNESGTPTNQIEKLTYVNGEKVFYFTVKQLMALKRGIGYTKNNSKEIDRDVMAILREYFKPIYFTSVTRSQEFTNKMDLDFMDREHLAGLIKASSLTDQLDKFDRYVEKLDKLVQETTLTDMELKLYRLLRNGKGLALELQFHEFEKNMITITECAKVLGVSQQRCNTIFNALADKVAEQYETMYEDYYFTYLARGNYKTCSKCSEVKLANERYFSINKTSKDNLHSVCKACRSKGK